MQAVRVLQSFGAPRPTTNPYIVMLGEALEHTPGIDLVRFSWRAALIGRYHVLHLHWPETLLGGSTPWRSRGKQAAFLLALLRARLTGKAIVRTVHNLDLPLDVDRFQRWLLLRVEAWTTYRVTISAATQLAPGTPASTVLHGHYRTWFEPFPRAEVVPGRLAFVGLIRRYKGIEALLRAFRETRDAPTALTLGISGNPSSAELAAEITHATDEDDRISADLRFLDNADFVRAVTQAELVVLPYRFMHNSGSLLAALSLDRPVLAPANEANAELSREVGLGWLHVYEGELSAGDLVRAVEDLRTGPPARPPDLSAREWDTVGPRHLAAYRAALATRRPRRRVGGAGGRSALDHAGPA